MGMTRIRNATIIDPVNGRNGDVGDLWIGGGTIVRSPEELVSGHETIDGHGLLAMAGGIDVHSHIAGPALQAGRLLQKEPHVQEGWTVPPDRELGIRYARMGYTLVTEAAMAPVWAWQTHRAFRTIPVVDKLAYVAAGTHSRILALLAGGHQKEAEGLMAWFICVSGGYALKVVNPEDPSGQLSWEKVTDFLLDNNERLGLPHGVHLHGLNIGQPGNVRDSCRIIRQAMGRRMHLAHVQFHSYTEQAPGQWGSGSEQILRALADHPEVSADSGLIHFGEAMTMTMDTAFSEKLKATTNRTSWLQRCGEDGGWATLPIRYRTDSRVNAIQWMTGLELILLADHRGQLSLSTDHPNGAPLSALPELIQCLMSEPYRREILKKLPPRARECCSLPGIRKECSPYEIAILTRAAPARTLGLRKKGHLGIGADADIALYETEQMHQGFAQVKHLIKAGRIVIRDGTLVAEPAGRTLAVRPEGMGEPGLVETGRYGIDREDWSRCQVLETGR